AQAVQPGLTSAAARQANLNAARVKRPLCTRMAVSHKIHIGMIVMERYCIRLRKKAVHGADERWAFENCTLLMMRSTSLRRLMRSPGERRATAVAPPPL